CTTSLQIVAIDRPGLLSDIIACISGHHLSMTSLETTTKDWIVNCHIEFGIHAYNELLEIIRKISSIKGVEEVMAE
ncbi:MAG: bifunctional (p)ppGpp synthetase/guanosine-3',5'-bis(diphosphate) 3'-pyrophosphohydrolase, partial [Bacteroidales bacterium]|nr:bifunctional (p)ppGpp synthetase/guanosine-3',5'-bis(diphosphate) 3'-pyrophosphohydrolase [Bacteroidales bacterium]